MKRLILAVFLILALPVHAETWVHVYGASWHEQPGYREINTGLGIEHRFDDRWTWAVGTFQNSIDRQSVAVLVKYSAFQQGDLLVNWQLGGVTGYRHYAIAPVILPELCVSWVCGMFVPRIGSETQAAVAFYLRIPI